MHTRDPDGIRTLHRTHSTRKDTWYCNCHPPPTLHHDWVNMAEVQLQIATYKHTPAARVRNLCAWPMLPYRFGVPVCSAPVTARAGSDLGAPRPLTGLVLCSCACVLHMPGPIRCWADVPPSLVWVLWCYQLLVCVARVCAHVCVYMPRCPSASGKCKGSVCE